MCSKPDQGPIQSHHPRVVQEIKNNLHKMHEAGAAMSVLTVCSVMLATIMSRAPEILDTPYRDGSTFRALDAFVRKWMRGQLNWSEHKVT